MEDFGVQAIDHVEFFVPDRAAAARWYAEVLGLAPVDWARPWADDPLGPLMISPDAGRTMVALFAGEPQGGHAAVGFSRLAFRVDGAGFLAFVERARALGLTEGGAPLRLRDHGQAISAYFSDPWGNRLEVTTYDPDRARRAVGPEADPP